jgi:hypothetical protein
LSKNLGFCFFIFIDGEKENLNESTFTVSDIGFDMLFSNEEFSDICCRFLDIKSLNRSS